MTDEGHAQTPSRWRTAQPFLVALVVAVAFFTFPPVGTDLGVNGDISLAAVLNYAHQHGLQFGPDITFTYGPLGWLVIFYYWPHLAGVRMLVDVALCLQIALSLCVLGWRLPVWWRWLLIGLFLIVAANLEPRLDLILEVGFFCAALLCIVESGRRLMVATLNFVIFAAFCALAKTSYFFLGLFTIVLLMVDLGRRGEWRAGAALAAGFPAAVLAGWLAANQKLINLPAFITNSFQVVQGYNQALAWEGLSRVRYTGFVVASLSVAVVVLRTINSFNSADRGAWLRPVVLLVWLSGMIFAVWKHSFVREDFRHPAFMMAFSPVLAVALEVLPSTGVRLKRWARVCSLLLCLASLWALQSLYLPPPFSAVLQPFRLAAYHLAALWKPGEYLRRTQATFEACRSEAALPELRGLTGNAGTDCFGYFQSYLLLNDFAYQPPPVFQSYAACNAQLTRLNERFYLSQNAPEYVLFCLASVDRKFPALEDARVLRLLLIDYELVAAERFFLLLKRLRNDKPQLTLLQEGVVPMGTPIDLRLHGDRNLWLEIGVEPSLAGRVRQFLFRPGTMRLGAWEEPGRKLLHRGRAPAASLNAGFVASPLLVRTEDVAAFYTNQPPARPGAYTIELQPGQQRWWKSEIRYRLYEIENPLGKSSGDILQRR